MILRQVETNKDEEPFVLEDFDNLLLKRRGYSFRIPSANEGVVFIVSGGLDSTISLARVLDNLECQVYPLYVQRGARSETAELSSVNHYISIFKKKYPRLHSLEILKADVPPRSFKSHIPNERLAHVGHPMRNAILQSYGIQYAVAVSNRDLINIKTVFTAISPNDMFPHCSLVALRAETVLACIDSGDWTWQVTSPLLEEGLWGTVSKSDAITYAFSHNINLAMTYTCTQTGEKACGICPECRMRLDAFRVSGHEDPIEYCDNSNK